MPDLVLDEEPEGGVGAAAIEAAAPPVVRCHIDAYADQSFPGHNFGDKAKLKLNGASGGDDQQAFLFFALPFPLGATVLDATLRVYLAADWAGAQVITAKRITDSWKEGRVTWDRRPAVTATHSAAAAVAGAPAGAEVELDLGPMLNDAAAGSAWFGVRLELGSDTLRKLWSSEAPDASLRPELEVEWVLPPRAPTELVPSGGRSIASAKPQLRWAFGDWESQGQTASQVQLSTTNDMSAIVFDSGKVANAVSLVDLADTAFAGLADGASLYWRVRVWNDADLVSDWSDIELFARNTLGVLEIVSPAEEPDNFVEELTPPLDFTFTGRTQVRASVQLFTLDALGLPLFDRQTHWHLTDETSVTVPRGLIFSGVTYRVVVKVWDDFDRQASAGERPYVMASRDFTYERAGTPAPITSLTATADRIVPKVALSWERVVEPDYFCIRVDGKEVLPRLEPDDLTVVGIAYTYDLWRGEPGTEHTYEVEAVVNSAGKLKHSEDNPVVSATPKVGGVWLVDDTPGEEIAVMLADREQSALGIGETGETYNLPGSRMPVRITDSIRGYEGSVSGVLLSKEALADFLELKGRLRELRLIQHTLNFPVRLGLVPNASPRPAPKGDGTDARFNASAEVFQVGEFPMAIAGG